MARRPFFVWLRRIWMTAGLGVTAWLAWNMQAHGVAAESLTSSAELTVDVRSEIAVFLPSPERPDRAGLVFLPGGGVDWRAYVPFVRAVAEAGYPAGIARLPYRLAPTDASRAEVWRRVEDVRAAWGPARRWVLSGHSRGAALAAGLADTYPDSLDGLVLIATTHPRDQDLSGLAVPVIKIVADHDCVASPQAARENAARLPAGTEWVDITGGNHAQFGHYGSQFNDCRATITREAQQEQARAAVVALLERVSAGARR